MSVSFRLKLLTMATILSISNGCAKTDLQDGSETRAIGIGNPFVSREGYFLFSYFKHFAPKSSLPDMMHIKTFAKPAWHVCLFLAYTRQEQIHTTDTQGKINPAIFLDNNLTRNISQNASYPNGRYFEWNALQEFINNSVTGDPFEKNQLTQRIANEHKGTYGGSGLRLVTTVSYVREGVGVSVYKLIEDFKAKTSNPNFDSGSGVTASHCPDRSSILNNKNID